MSKELDKTDTYKNEQPAPDVPPRPYLFILFDGARTDVAPARRVLDGVDIVHLGRGPAFSLERKVDGTTRELDVRLPDSAMSSNHAQIVRGKEDWLFEDLGSKNGSFINGVRKPLVLLKDGDLLELGRTFFTFRMLASEDISTSEKPPLPELETLIPDLHRQFEDLVHMAKSDLPILLTGESGTGKEVLARAVHQLSGRAGEFTAINCGALASSVLEAELFGVRRGAFTGANDRDGLIRAAQGGTLFLDEIGELPLGSQPAFLRALQELEVVPVGGTHPISVDFRLICATNRDLSTQVARGEFREDLLSRISGWRMHVPALRERREDLAFLVPRLIERQARRLPPTVATTVMRAMLLYDWPRNIRELQTCLHTAVELTAGRQRQAIELDVFPEYVRYAFSLGDEHAQDGALPSEIELAPEDRARREELIGLLRAYHGNVAQVARSMNKAPTQITRWLRRYQLDPKKFKV